MHCLNQTLGSAPRWHLSQVATWFGSKPIPSCVQSVKIPLTLDSTQAPQDTPRRWMMDEKNLM